VIEKARRRFNLMQRHPTFIPVTPSLPSPPGSPLSPFENDEKEKV